MPLDKQSPWFLALLAAIGTLVYVAVLLNQPKEITDRIRLGRNDFIQLYAGAKLAGSPDLYARDAIGRIQREEAGMESGEIYFLRLPAYACALRPLAWLPYLRAYWLFQGISLLCFLAFLWMFVPAARELAAFASLSIPLYATIQNGQDTALVLFFMGLSVVLARKKLDFWAGAVLSLCAIKFHLLMLIPLALVIQRRWWILRGGIAGSGCLLILSFASAGLDWPRRYLAALNGQNPHPEYMPNLHTLSALLGRSDLAVESVLSLGVTLAVAYLAWRLPDYELAFAFAVVGSLLVSVHSYTQDCLILLLPVAILLAKPFSKRVRALAELTASPIPYFFVLAGTPMNLAMPSLLLSILAAAIVTVWQSGSGAHSESKT